GIEFAVGEGVDVISLSLGGEWVDSTYDDPTVNAVEAAIQAGVTVVIAAGNTGPAVYSINTPAIADEAIAVGASSGDAGVVPFSSRGPLYRSETEPTGYFAKPDIIAPGYQVFTARDDSSSTYEYPIYNSSDYGNTYTLFSGTSSSAPQIAALAALLLDKHPSLTPTEIKVFLMEGATDLGADPMEQGYGLANVTRSSEIIANTSSMLTLMTPLRYPTLPGTSSVFIMGDDRPDQDITVISTVNRGAVDITLQGNASDYIIISNDEITITVGYQHFGIGLAIPEDLPLSAMGNYFGNLTLVLGEEVISSMEIEFVLTAYGGTVLVDMAHHDANDPDDISYYTHFGKFLREQGIIFSELPENWEDVASSATIDGNSLAGIEVLMIMDTELDYTETEIESIHEFVEDGGKLLILSEGFDTDNSVPAFAFSDYNAILEPYGIQCEENWIGSGVDLYTGLAYGVDHGGVVDDHVLTEGVDNLYILNGGTLSVDSTVAGAQGLLWTDAQRTHALIAYAEKGNGSVIVISDGSTLYDTSIYDAIRLGADNLQLLENIAGQLQTEKPKIYDVVLTTGAFGENANVTAYIFDDDLEQVQMIIEGPQGDILDILLTESLGYKFVASFLYESAGFYRITIIANDIAGHTQTFTKLVLIPIDAADDMFILTVIIVLLGVVAVGVGYVAVLHFGGKRRARPRKIQAEKEEWTPPWDNDSQPPAIE
ncbi:MAG: S8 family serine peptidase, partial [Candidatus Thorarchaeota archaeon]